MKKTYKTKHPLLKTITEGDKLITYKGAIFQLDYQYDDDKSSFVFIHIIVEDGHEIYGGTVGFPIDLGYKEKDWGIKGRYISLKEKIDLL